jgi:hypothetical protein
MTSYLLALVSCGIAWVRGRKAPFRWRLAAVLAILEAALFVDIVFNGRWLLHEVLENEAIEKNLYVHRGAPQLVALGFLGVAVAAGMGLALWRLRGRAGASLATCGAILSLSCWCVEVISLHATDAAFQYMVDGVMLVSVGWAVCCLMTSVGILWDAFAAGRPARVRKRTAVTPSATFTNS